MKEFINENFPFVVLLILIILGFCFVFHLFEARQEFYEKIINYAIETNSVIEIK